jgi:hypothetical protein
MDVRKRIYIKLAFIRSMHKILLEYHAPSAKVEVKHSSEPMVQQHHCILVVLISGTVIRIVLSLSILLYWYR